jgi:hypothetical protein
MKLMWIAGISAGLMLTASTAFAADTYDLTLSRLDHGGQLFPTLTSSSMVVTLHATGTTPDSGPPVWELRNASTGEVVCWLWASGDDASSRRAECNGLLAMGVGHFYSDWRVEPTDERKWIVLELDGMSGHSLTRIQGVATKRAAPVPPPPTPSASVTITSPINGATIKSSVPIRIETKGLAAGTMSYEIFVNATRRWFWRTTQTAITQWFTTTTVPNGTHTIHVKVTDSGGKVVETSVSVRVMN